MSHPKARSERTEPPGVKRLSLEDIALGTHGQQVELAVREAGDTILFCGGQALFRAGLQSLVSARDGLYVLGETEDLADAAQAMERLHPTIAVVDVGSCPPETGPLLRRLRRVCPDARILAVTSEDHPETRRQLLASGATIVVAKDEPADIFLHAIAFLRTGSEQAPGPALAGDVATRAPLSAREFDVVRLLCRGLRNEEIARVLSISEATVRHHLTSIFAKRRVTNRAALIVQAYNSGWTR
jgi:DNA-binding NarL/FixJ family response regulator